MHWECFSCGELNDETYAECLCGSQRQADNENNSKIENSSVKMTDKFNHILLVTTPTIPGSSIIKALGIVSAQIASPAGKINSIMAIPKNLIVGGSHETDNLLETLKNICFYNLKKEAFKMGGNAIVSVNISFSNYSTLKDFEVIGMIATGTAVEINY